MNTPDPSRRDPDSPGPGAVGAGIGVVLLMILCCAGPALLASGALAGLGAWLGNPWVIAAAVLLAVGAFTFVVHRRAQRRAACCPPTTSETADRDHRTHPATNEGPHAR
jgi:mercuric ion transport protein